MDFEDWCGPFTRDLDEYLKDEFKKIDIHRSYVMVEKDENGNYEDDPCFRVPGYTVGWLVLSHKDGIIKEVHFNEISSDTNQFVKTPKELENILSEKYVGKVLELDKTWL